MNSKFGCGDPVKVAKISAPYYTGDGVIVSDGGWWGVNATVPTYAVELREGQNAGKVWVIDERALAPAVPPIVQRFADLVGRHDCAEQQRAFEKAVAKLEKKFG